MHLVGDNEPGFWPGPISVFQLHCRIFGYMVLLRCSGEGLWDSFPVTTIGSIPGCEEDPLKVVVWPMTAWIDWMETGKKKKSI